jgi:hypothetical protein
MKKIKLLLFVLSLILACKMNPSSASVSTAPEAGSAVYSAVVTYASPITNTIKFCGYTWTVKSGSGMGPGPNTWGDKNIWVDSKGWMHLKLSYDAASGKWLCAGVTSTQSFGHGTYQWKIQGPISAMDKNVVAGLFHYSGPDDFNEMDIEFARWGKDINPNVNYSVYPAAGATTAAQHLRTSWAQTGGTASTHRYTWTSDSVIFKSMNGYYDDDTNMFITHTFTPPATSIPTVSMPVKMNLWCFHGLAPTNGQNVEIVIHEFKFTALP